MFIIIQIMSIIIPLYTACIDQCTTLTDTSPNPTSLSPFAPPLTPLSCFSCNFAFLSLSPSFFFLIELWLCWVLLAFVQTFLQLQQMGSALQHAVRFCHNSETNSVRPAVTPWLSHTKLNTSIFSLKFFLLCP